MYIFPMSLFVRGRGLLFSISAPLGAVATAVLFFAFGGELLASRVVRFYGKSFLFPIGILPILLAYEIGYFLNRLLMRAFGGDELRSVQRTILTTLVDGYLTSTPVHCEPPDLLEEEAWAMLKKYWRKR